jgi:hypothetical protein
MGEVVTSDRSRDTACIFYYCITVCIVCTLYNVSSTKYIQYYLYVAAVNQYKYSQPS